MSAWFVYLIRCRDGSLYTGISVDPQRRLLEHQRGGPRGAKYLRGKGPLQLVFRHPAADRSSASKLECCLKKLTRSSKEQLISGQLDPTALLDQPPV